MLVRLDIENKIVSKEVLIENHPKIGRIRDFEVSNNGDIYVISDDYNTSLWLITKTSLYQAMQYQNHLN